MSRISLGANLSSLQAQTSLRRSSEALQRTFERLSSGQRINRASDDAAGLAVSLGLNNDSRVYTQGLRNINDGISALNIASGGLGQLSNITTRLKELAIQSANGVFSRTQRLSLDIEGKALTDEFNRILSTMQFNGRSLMDASLNQLRIQAGYGTNGGIAFGMGQELDRTVGQGSYAARVSYINDGGGTGVETADMNGDGKLDIITSDFALGIIINYGDGNGGVSSSVIIGGASSNVAIGDVNNDGRPDIIGSSQSNPQDIELYVNQGNGSFSTVSLVGGDAGGTGGQIEFGDFNGDNKLDIAATAEDGYVSVFLGNGNATFQARRSFVSGGTIPSDLQIGDMNGDGKQDLVIALDYTSIGILYGQGNGNFAPARVYSVSGGINEIQLADLNFDGVTDIVGYANEINVLLGNANGSFKAPVSYAAQLTYGYFDGLELGDLNGDGFLDIAVAGYSTNTILLGNGNGSFKAAYSFASGNASGTSIGLGDLNGDGVLDVISSGDSGGFGVFLANTQQVTNIQRLNLTTQAEAQNGLAIIDGILDRIGLEQGAIGSSQSRLQSALNTLSSTRENLMLSYGRIVDADVATESAELTRNQILQSTASAVLSQANLQPNLVLLLLKS